MTHAQKKAMDSKLKDLYEKYKTPANYKYLCVPKVNLELWHDCLRSVNPRTWVKTIGSCFRFTK